MSTVFIVVGHNASGKTYVSKKLAKDLPVEHINGDDYRNFIIKHYRYFSKVDISLRTERGAQLSQLTIDYRFQLLKTLLESGQDIIFDGSGATVEWRKKIITKAKNVDKSARVVIIYTAITEESLIKRLDERDIQQLGSEWREHYTSFKRELFEIPSLSEADGLLIYNQTNYKQVLKEARSCLET